MGPRQGKVYPAAPLSVHQRRLVKRRRHAPPSSHFFRLPDRFWTPCRLSWRSAPVSHPLL